MTTADIAAFLLARNAEREAQARYLQEQLASGYYDSSPDWLDLVDDLSWVLADCAAKRAIVEECTEALAKFERSDVWGGWSDIDMKQFVEWILELLVQPYAAHPDFRPEWHVG